MGLNPLWQEDIFLTVQTLHQSVRMLVVKPYFIIDTQRGFLIHLIPLRNEFLPEDLIKLQSNYQSQHKHLIHLWEDVWQTKRHQTLNRITSFLGLNKGIYGRKVKVIPLNVKQSFEFLNAHHLQGFVNAKHHYGLTLNDEIVALASFSEEKMMKQKGENYKSAELVRFASKAGFTIVGGLSKLIKHHLKDNKLNDLMTYADKDWSLGRGYEALGFNLSEETKPLIMYVELESLTRFAPHRLPKNLLTIFKAQNVLNLDEFMQANGYVKLFNTGNLKFHLYL